MATTERRRGAGGPHLALFDANSLIARGVKDLLASRSFPASSVRLFTSNQDPEANLTEFAGEAALVTRPDRDDLGRLDLAFLCGTEREGELYLDWPGRNGFVAIDLSGAARRNVEVPLVNMSVNPQAVVTRPGLIATPHPVAHFLSSLLAPVLQGADLEHATAVIFQPASECGDAGIEELYKQTLGLLNFHDQPRENFGRQLAFNLIPSALYRENDPPGGAQPARLEREVRRITGGDYSLSVEVVLAPVFHCHAALVHIVLPRGAVQDRLLACFADSPEITVSDTDQPATPVDRAGQPGILITGVRPGGETSSFWIWAVIDNLVSGSALNAVRIAEALIAQGLGGGGR